MKVVYSWLKDFVKIPNDVSISELVDRLTRSVVEVDGVVDERKLFDHIICGRILHIDKHPNADRLSLVTVDAGKLGNVSVVCGGNNLCEKQIVALALPGARVRWHGEGDLITLEAAKVRGVESFGMICSAKEIGLDGIVAEPEGGIADLTSFNVKPGTPLADVFGKNDAIIDIDNKSINHRPDLWSQYGIAREVSALYKANLVSYESVFSIPTKKILSSVTKSKKLSVTIKDNRCVRYIGAVISGVAPIESPVWMKERLLKAGMRPRNILVDVTNYVMIEYGNPLHAFDYNKITDGSIIVRKAEDKEKIIALDDVEYELDQSIMVIADKEKSVAIAGVIGGKNDSINDSTNTIVLEAAAFDAVAVRRASMNLGIRTDASARFEKALDPYFPENAICRAICIIKELFPGATIDAYIDENKLSYVPKVINITEEQIKSAIGDDRVTASISKNILDRLGFDVKEKKGVLSVTVPSWRATKDISIQSDLIEEIARMYGYENIPVKLPVMQIERPQNDQKRYLVRSIKNLLALRYNCTEQSLYPFINDSLVNAFSLSADGHIRVRNAINAEATNLRTLLLPNLAQSLSDNMHRADALSFFEIGRVFIKKEGDDDQYPESKHNLPYQPYHTSIVLYGNENGIQNIKNILNDISRICNENIVVEQAPESAPAYINSGSYGNVLVQGKTVGYIGALSANVLDKLGLKKNTYVCEFDLDQILDGASERKSFKELPLYPVVKRDLSPLVDKKVSYKMIEKTILTVDPRIIKIDLVGVFEKGDKKSVTVRFFMRRDDKTWESSEIDDIFEGVIKALESKCGAVVPR